jgi:hypothetical protein
MDIETIENVVFIDPDVDGVKSFDYQVHKATGKGEFCILNEAVPCSSGVILHTENGFNLLAPKIRFENEAFTAHVKLPEKTARHAMYLIENYRGVDTVFPSWMAALRTHYPELKPDGNLAQVDIKFWRVLSAHGWGDMATWIAIRMDADQKRRHIASNVAGTSKGMFENLVDQCQDLVTDPDPRGDELDDQDVVLCTKEAFVKEAGFGCMYEHGARLGQKVKDASTDCWQFLVKWRLAMLAGLLIVVGIVLYFAHRVWGRKTPMMKESTGELILSYMNKDDDYTLKKGDQILWKNLGRDVEGREKLQEVFPDVKAGDLVFVRPANRDKPIMKLVANLVQYRERQEASDLDILSLPVESQHEAFERRMVDARKTRIGRQNQRSAGRRVQNTQATYEVGSSSVGTEGVVDKFLKEAVGFEWPEKGKIFNPDAAHESDRPFIQTYGPVSDETYIKEAWTAAHVGQRYMRSLENRIVGTGAMGCGFRIGNALIAPRHFQQHGFRSDEVLVGRPVGEVRVNNSNSSNFTLPEVKNAPNDIDACGVVLPRQLMGMGSLPYREVQNGEIIDGHLITVHPVSLHGRIEPVKIVVRNGSLWYRAQHMPGICGGLLLDDANVGVGFHTDGASARSDLRCKGVAFTREFLDWAKTQFPERQSLFGSGVLQLPSHMSSIQNVESPLSGRLTN